MEERDLRGNALSSGVIPNAHGTANKWRAGLAFYSFVNGAN